MRDPYKVLGVSPSASDREIKQAYRRLAKELHPDTKPGDASVAERFKEVSAAYKLLSDKETRAKYDRGEIDANGQPRQHFRYEYAGGPGGGQGFSGFHFDFGGRGGGPDDLFADFADLFGGARGPRRPRSARGVDHSYRIKVSFLDAAKGTTRRVTLPGGKTLDVRIPPGIESGRAIRLRGQGGAGPAGGPAGDALIEVEVEPHPYFSRAGLDIHLDLPISLGEAVLGATVSVPTIDGPVQVKVPKNANTGRKLRLKNRGIQGAAGRGDQYVILRVVLPDGPDAKLAELLQRWGRDYGDEARRKAGLV